MRKGIKIKNLSHNLQFKMKQSGMHKTYCKYIKNSLYIKNPMKRTKT